MRFPLLLLLPFLILCGADFSGHEAFSKYFDPNALEQEIFQDDAIDESDDSKRLVDGTLLFGVPVDETLKTFWAFIVWALPLFVVVGFNVYRTSALSIPPPYFFV